ncbi:MAG: nucleotidyltransferase domain-containing protein, partial [Chloroflexota bacterium]|nr:nucleotidyltransferase domain-containing protein [Chloroflexota bacterium]
SLTNLLDDFVGTERPAEGIFIADELAVEAASLLLLLNRRWIGSGKWVYRALARFDPSIADRLVAALRAYYRLEEKAELLTVVEEVLDQAGGPLFEGYRASGTRLE